MSDRRLADLCPVMQTKYARWKSLCNAAGLSVTAIVTWRDSAEQNVAKAQGLSNAAAGQSPHNCCLDDGTPFSKAFDFGVFDNGEYIKNGQDPRYLKAGKIGKECGLVWGGDWHHPDWDHLELPNWKTP